MEVSDEQTDTAIIRRNPLEEIIADRAQISP